MSGQMAGNIPEKDKWVVGPGWHMISVPRALEEGDKTEFTHFTAIQRDSDGFTLISEGGNSIEGFEWYICRAKGVPDFKIETDCRGLPYELMSDTIIVGVDISETPDEMIYKYAKDIEAGLLAYPPVNTYNYVPPKYVKFDVSNIWRREKQRLVTAEEIQT